MRDTADQVSPNIHQAMTLFDLVLWPFVSLGPQVLPWHILMKFLALASCYWRWDPCNLRCGCWKGFCPQQQGSAWFLGPKALGFLGRWIAHWILIQALGSFFGGWCHWMWGWSCVPWAGLVRKIFNYIFIKKTVWWWGKIWFILWFWLLLSTLSAVCSVSLHSGAARADQSWCHKRQRLLKQTETDATSGSCSWGHI